MQSFLPFRCRYAYRHWEAKLLKHMQRLTSHQSANKKYHSTETLNVTVTDEFLEAMDKKMLSAMVLLDLPKAFDSIDHTILLHRLASAGASPLL